MLKLHNGARTIESSIVPSGELFQQTARAVPDGMEPRAVRSYRERARRRSWFHRAHPVRL